MSSRAPSPTWSRPGDTREPRSSSPSDTTIPLLRGRLLDERDDQAAAPAVVINRKAAEDLFPGQDPLGQQVSLGPPTAPKRTIVGVVGDVRHQGLDLPLGYQVYVPNAQWAWAETFMTVVVRTEAPPAALAGPLRDLVRALDPRQPVTNVRPYRDVVRGATATRRFAAGLLVGLGLAALSAGALRSLLYGVRPLDPSTFAGAALVLSLAAVTVCGLPAWRAATLDPAETLRAE